MLPLAKNFQNESFLVVHGTGDGELSLTVDSCVAARSKHF